MRGIQTINGKAFEYACLDAMRRTMEHNQSVIVEQTPALQTALRSYNNTASQLKGKLVKSAEAVVRGVTRLEPQLEYPEQNIPLYLSIQADAKGIAGDVRDVLCFRKQNGWEIGLSCKHNNHAVKHSRLSGTIDFGAEWFGLPCSSDYFAEITPLFAEMKYLRDNAGALWASVESKAERFYVPVLQSFMDELRRIDNENPRIAPERLIQYLIGKNDFYKVITDDTRETVRIEGFNISGTLNRSSGGHNSIVNIAKLKLPTRFYHIGFKAGSNTTIEVTCDEGWSVSMRIHNASSRVEPSLKFDVNLISLPNTIHAQVEPW